MTKVTQEQLAAMPVWHLDRMCLPRGGFSPEERALAQGEIKRRFAPPVGAIKIPPKEEPLPDASSLISVPGGGWIWRTEQGE